MARDSHPINGYADEKQQRRLTFQKATKVVEGKMYILPDFSLKTNFTYMFFGLASLSKILRKHLQG
jgi:hypothetical protein